MDVEHASELLHGLAVEIAVLARRYTDAAGVVVRVEVDPIFHDTACVGAANSQRRFSHYRASAEPVAFGLEKDA